MRMSRLHSSTHADTHVEQTDHCETLALNTDRQLTENDIQKENRKNSSLTYVDDSTNKIDRIAVFKQGHRLTIQK